MGTAARIYIVPNRKCKLQQ